MQTEEVRFFDFGEFRLDARRRILTKNDELIQMQNRHFELLLALVENAGQILSQDDLIDKVWDGAFIEQSNLKKGISALRHILGESPNDGEFIRTVPRKGYSFVASVRTSADETVSEVSAPKTQLSANQTIINPPKIKSAFPYKYLFALIPLLLLVLIFFGWRFLRPVNSAIDLSRMRIEPLTTLGNVGFGQISRNGEYVLFGASENSLFSLWLKHLPTGKLTSLLKPQKALIYGANFAPDGESVYLWIYYEDEPTKSGLFKLNISGGELNRVSDKNIGIKFSPNAKRIAYRPQNINEKGESAIFTANPDFTDEKMLFSFNPSETFIQDYDWSPDGRFITYVARSVKNNQKKYFIAQIPAEGGAEQLIIPPRSDLIFSANWFPDGNSLAVSAVDPNTQLRQIWRVTYPNGEWQRITNDLTSYGYVVTTPDGNGIIASQQRDISNLWAGQTDGQNFRQISFDTIRYDSEISWLNEETILFSISSGDNFEIWAMSADGNNRRQLTSSPKDDVSPRATTDGKRILFISNRSGMRQVWQMDADGNNPRQLTNSAVEVRDFKILPDGQNFVYDVWLPTQGATLFKRAIEGGEIKQLWIPSPYYWDISPDGKLIAFANQTDKGMKVRISPLEENKPFQEFTFGDFDKIVWSKDSKALLYDLNENAQIMRQPIEGGAPQQITNFNSNENIWNFDLSPSSKRIVTRRTRQFFDLMLIKLDAK